MKKRTSKRKAIDRAPKERKRAKPTVGSATPASNAPQGERPFPVVGIGASAGGLEALEQFLKQVPERSGMAFVVIQHLDPTRKGTLAELLQRSTAMPVAETKDGQRVEPNHVYVIPPAKDLSILHGHLHLLPQKAPRGLNLPIDFFFRSLAEDQQERSIGVILSGMGSDGMLGLRAIKEKAGAGFVQALGSAKFDGMPRSAIDAGLADVVAPAHELPARIKDYVERAPYLVRREDLLEDREDGSPLEKVFVILRAQTGNDFSLYKRSTIHRRVARRMGLHQIDKLPDYIRYLRDNPREVDHLFRELLIGVTSFFRDPDSWKFLQAEALPTLLGSRPSGSVIRAWVPGCSTGEEAYSLAIAFKEALGGFKAPKNLTFQVFATDLDQDAIDKARVGLYPANIAADLSPERLRRFFVETEGGYRVNKEVREMVVFAPQNVIMDPPFTRLDFIACRNLLIYLAPELQRKLIPLFHYALNPGGILFLGSAETVGAFSGLFGLLDAKTRVYRRLEAGVGAERVDFPAAFVSRMLHPPVEAGAGGPIATPSTSNLQTLADRVLVQRFSPAAILATDKGEILYISGRTGKYLEPAAGRASMNLFAMAREGLRLDLSNAFSEALREERPVHVTGLKVGTNGGTQTVNLTLQKLTEPKELRGAVMVVIADAPDAPVRKTKKSIGAPEALSDRADLAEAEVKRSREELQTLREEMQTSQEELKSTNEELQSTNEELQSTNEELTTSKEEMQSMNEELQTVNHELQSKVDELSRSNNDMKNLLDSTDIATLFLDGNLCIRRFTAPMTSLIKLIATDVGRPISDIATEVQYSEMTDDAAEVLRTLVSKERVVSATRNRWFAVRVMPYRTIDNLIDGVVVTFTDASTMKRMESELSQQASEFRQMVESMPNLVLRCREDGTCDYVSPQWMTYTGASAAELVGFGWLHALHDDDRDRARRLWRAAVQSSAETDFEFRLKDKRGEFRWFKLRAVPIRDPFGELVKWYATSTDVDDLKRTADRRQAAAERLISILDHVSEPFFSIGKDFAVSYVNDAAEEALGKTRAEVLQKSFFQFVPEAETAPFRDTLQKVARDGDSSSFETELRRSSFRGSFVVRVVPGPDGVGVLFQTKNGARVKRETDGDSRRG